MLRWRRSQPDPSCPTSLATAECEPGEQKCPGVTQVLERLLAKDEQPQVLDLASHSGPTASFLAESGARVCVEAFCPPDPALLESELSSPMILIDQPDESFDLVLAWEHLDFLPPHALVGWMSELGRITRPGGFVALYARDSPSHEAAARERPGRFRLLGQNRMLREPIGQPIPRWFHPTRRIEQALQPLSVQGIHLQRNRMREFLVLKPRPRRDG